MLSPPASATRILATTSPPRGPGHAWDRLPVWNPRSVPVTAPLATTLARGEMPELAADHAPLWDGTRPTTMAGWIDLGRRVFFEFPMRAEVYVYSLAPPDTAPSPEHPRGAALFAAHCSGCHANAARGGRVIPADVIGTDPALATGPGRGTGGYRVPPLVRVRDGAPYLHDGSLGSLDELLSAARLDPEYRAGRLGPGPIPGHRAGTDLSPDERAELIAYLGTL